MLLKKIEVQRFFFTILIVTVSAIATAQERQEIHGSVPLQMDARKTEYLRENARQRLNSFLNDELERAVNRLIEAYPSTDAREIRDRLEQYAWRFIKRLSDDLDREGRQAYWDAERLMEMELRLCLDREVEAEIHRQKSFGQIFNTEFKALMSGQTIAVDEQDSLALVALYNSTDGDNWKNNSNWLKGPVASWYGIKVEDKRVSRIDLFNNQLTGIIPPEIGNLTKLKELTLWYNQISGIIPAEIINLKNLRHLLLSSNQLCGNIPPGIGNLTDLWDLDLSGNLLTGSILSEIGNLTNLYSLYLVSNQFIGAIPQEICNLIYLEYLWIENNRFTDLPNLQHMAGKLTSLRIRYNQLTFKDIEPNIGITEFLYAPQDSVDTDGPDRIVADEPFTCSVSVGGTANQYQWFKDGTIIPGGTETNYSVASASPTDAGVYHCRITNTIATALTLYSRQKRVEVEAEPYLTVDPTSLTLGSAADSQGSFSVTSNVSWSVSKDTDWLAVSPDSTTGNATVTATATSANTSADSRWAMVTVSGSGISRTVAVAQLGSPTIPDETAELNIHPNPFTPNGDGFNDLLRFDSRGMGYSSPEVVIFNMKGAEIRRLTNPGGDEIVWDGRDREGRLQPPGVYIYMLSEGGSVVTKGTVVLAL